MENKDDMTFKEVPLVSEDEKEQQKFSKSNENENENRKSNEEKEEKQEEEKKTIFMLDFANISNEEKKEEEIEIENVILPSPRSPSPVGDSEKTEQQKKEYERAKFLSVLPPIYQNEILKSEEELIEELIEQTINSSPIYDSKEALFDDNDASRLYWAKTLSSYTKRRKRQLYQTLRIYFSKSDAHFNLLQRQIILSLLPLHHYTLSRMFECSLRLEPSFDLEKYDVFDLPIKTKKNRLPTSVLELNYERAIASLRFAKHLYLLGEIENAHEHCDNTLKLFFRIFLNERKKKTFTQLVFKKWIKAFELLTFVKGKESKVVEYVDLFLMQFSNMVMKEKAYHLDIKPLLEMNYSDSRHLTDANSIEVLQYFQKFLGDTKLGIASAEALTELDNLPLMLRKEQRLKELIDVKGRRMMRDSGLRRREYCFRPDIIWNLLIRRYDPKFSISVATLPKFQLASERMVDHIPYSHFSFLPLSAVEMTLFGTAVSDQTNQKQFVKIFRSIEKYPVKTAYEMSLLLHLSSLPNFLKVHSHFQYQSDLYCIFEGETEGYFLHELLKFPRAFKESDIAFISMKILESLRDLHSHKLSLRDFTGKNIFITTSGEVVIIPNFFYENYNQRFYIPPETLIPSSKFLPFAENIWAFACILYELCEYSTPYAHYHPLKEMFYISTSGLPEINKEYSDELQVFYSLASDVNPSNRLTAAQLLEHEFIAKSEESSADQIGQIIQSFL